MPRLTRLALALSAALLLMTLGAFLSACSDGSGKPESYLETGDLAALKERGVLRILVPFLEAPRLARQGPLPQDEVDLAARVAEDLGLEARIVTVKFVPQPRSAISGRFHGSHTRTLNLSGRYVQYGHVKNSHCTPNISPRRYSSVRSVLKTTFATHQIRAATTITETS